MRETKPPGVPQDIWQTCNDQQRRWVVQQAERDARQAKVRARIIQRAAIDASIAKEAERG